MIKYLRTDPPGGWGGVPQTLAEFDFITGLLAEYGPMGRLNQHKVLQLPPSRGGNTGPWVLYDWEEYVLEDDDSYTSNMQKILTNAPSPFQILL